MSVKFRRNPAFEDEIRAEPGYHAEMLHNGEEVAKTAEILAPKNTRYYVRHTGVKTISFAGFTGRLAQLAERAANSQVVVTTTDFAGHMVEWGSAKNPPYAPIRRAVRAVGLRLRELPKP